MATTAAPNTIGKIIQVIGPVLDVEFETDQLPELYNALTINAVAPSGQTSSARGWQTKLHSAASC